MNLLPNIILYLASGFCFIKAYKYSSLTEEYKNIEHILLESLVVGYIICSIMKLIPINTQFDNVGIVIISIISGISFSKIINSSFFTKFLESVKIYRTPNAFLWNDLVDNDYAIKAKILINGNEYYGYVHLIEEFSNSPHIALANYSIDGKHNENHNEVIVLNTAKADSVIIEYNQNSKKIEDFSFK